MLRLFPAPPPCWLAGPGLGSDRHARGYCQPIPGPSVCFGGDAAASGTGGCLWFSSRAGEIIKIAGHRLGTIEAETAFPRHPPPPKPG